ncbi:hypothetical protein RM555_20160 [Micromonospora sp. DSM 115977]|uniref:Mce-associated membrane protein n=1 Tax=Micromonospora reichwaldensis TaxID=3075516 RepID=A0ABU2X0J1_9ACTN|nr:hypothetical protein [Micromonospora sp. DSM 115977]MDT0531305.1 hypothetical protein [Micromonospora sp. DSM 115977]
MQPPAGSQVSRVPAQRPPSDHLAPPSPAPVPERPRRRLRTVVTVVASVVAALCLGGVAAGFVLYNRAAAPDRSAPDVVVDNYLRAFLVDRNDTRANLFTCEGSGDRAAVLGLRSEIEQREANFDVVVRVSWGPLTRTETSEGESVATTLTISGSANGQPRSSRREDWVFDVAERDEGWRVCSGRKAG